MTTTSQISASPAAVKAPSLAFPLLTYTLMAFILTFDMLMVTAVLPAMSVDLSIAKSQLGWVAGSHALTFCLAALLMAPLSDRFGRRVMLISGMVIFIASNFLCAAAGSFSILLLYRMLAGIGSAMIMPNIWSSVGHIFPMQRLGRAMSIVWSGVSMATIIGIPLAAYVAGKDWGLMFNATAYVSILFLVLFFFVPVGRQMKQNISYIQQFGVVLRHLGAVRALSSTFFWNLSLFGTYALVGSFYHNMYEFDTKSIGFAILFGGVGNFLGSMLSGKYGDKYNKRNLLRITALLAAVTVLPFTLGLGLIPSLILQAVWSMAVGFGAGSLTATVIMQKPEARGTLMSLNSSFMNASIVIGGALSGYLLDIIGHFAAVGAMSAAAALLVILLVPAIPKPGSKA